jgi:hypothetical protein
MSEFDGLTHASWMAVDGINRAIARIEATAHKVAVAAPEQPGDPTAGGEFDSVRDLVAARRDAISNAAVLNRIESLDRELLRAPRR